MPPSHALLKFSSSTCPALNLDILVRVIWIGEMKRLKFPFFSRLFSLPFSSFLDQLCRAYYFGVPFRRVTNSPRLLPRPHSCFRHDLEAFFVIRFIVAGG